MSRLTDAICEMNRAKLAYEEACEVAWQLLLVAHPEVSVAIQDLGMEPTAVSRWFCSQHFDNGTKTALELFDEGRGSEVIRQIDQIVHGVYR